MKLSKVSIAILFAAVLLMMAAIPSGIAVKGPREDDLAVYFYASQEAAYTALTNGDIDFMWYDLTTSQADNAFANPNLITARVPDYGFYEMDLNNNWTITTYPGVRSPMNYTEMRQACAFLCDKDYFVGTLLGGRGQRIDQMIAGPVYGWANESMSYPNYPYEFDPAAASALLDTRFPVGTTPNPYYDAGFPGSVPYIRTFPAGHSLAGQDLHELMCRIRSDHSPRLQAGRSLYQGLRKLGVPCDVLEAPSATTYPIVMGEFNYHIYTGGWSVGRFPPLSLYGLYHSINAFPYGSNYVTGADFAGVPGDYQTHPKLDDLLYAGNYAGSYSEAVGSCKLAGGYMTELCVNVPLWSVATYWAWNKQLLGVVNLQGDDPENAYTCLNAYKIDLSPIRAGIIQPPNQMNLHYSSWVYDWQCLNRMNIGGGTDVPAYNVALDQAGFVTDWETTTWDDGGTLKTLVRNTWRSDGYFTKPVSGDIGENINADHYFFNAWFDYQVSDGWGSTGFIDLHHVVKTGPYSFDIYFDTSGYWNTYYCQYYLRPMDTWMTNLMATSVETFTDPTTPGDIGLTYDPIWINYVKWNGVDQTMFTDYNIVLGSLHVYSTLGTGTLEVSYYYVPADAIRGYYPGSLPWETIFEGGGMYYCTAFTAGLGGSITYKKSQYYYCVTPLLGEIDFVKKTSGPYAGNYQVDIFDLAIAGAAFGSQATGIPSDKWVAGADLAPDSGKIDILDLVTVTGTNWDKAFDPIEP